MQKTNNIIFLLFSDSSKFLEQISQRKLEFKSNYKAYEQYICLYCIKYDKHLNYFCKLNVNFPDIIYIKNY